MLFCSTIWNMLVFQFHVQFRSSSYLTDDKEFERFRAKAGITLLSPEGEKNQVRGNATTCPRERTGGERDE